MTMTSEVKLEPEADPGGLDDPIFDHEYLAAQSKKNYERARAKMRAARFARSREARDA